MTEYRQMTHVDKDIYQDPTRCNWAPLQTFHTISGKGKLIRPCRSAPVLDGLCHPHNLLAMAAREAQTGVDAARPARRIDWEAAARRLDDATGSPTVVVAPVDRPPSRRPRVYRTRRGEERGCYQKPNGRWKVFLYVRGAGRMKHVGTFDTLTEAQAARNAFEAGKNA